MIHSMQFIQGFHRFEEQGVEQAHYPECRAERLTGVESSGAAMFELNCSGCGFECAYKSRK